MLCIKCFTTKQKKGNITAEDNNFQQGKARKPTW